MDEIQSDPSKFVMIFRPNMVESDFNGTLPIGARCLYSRWTGYLEQSEWQKTGTQLDEVNGDLIEVHTSGHIYADDIISFVGQINAKTVIPIHTFEAELFVPLVANIRLLNDGEPLTVNSRQGLT